MSNILSLPNELSEEKNHLVLFDCTKLLGQELGKYCDLKMREIDGPDWLKNLGALRQQYKINLYDLAFLLKETLSSDSPIRQILPKSPSFYNKLTILKRVRNENQHFSFKHTNSATKEAVEVHFDIALELNLTLCIEEFNLMIRRLNDLEAGKSFQADPNLILKLGELEMKKAEMEDQLIEKNILLNDKENKLNHVQKIITENNSRIENLVIANEQKTSAFNMVSTDLEKSKQEAEELRKQLNELNAQKQSDEITEKEIEKIIATLVGSLSTHEVHASFKQANKAKLEHFSPEVGSLWNKPKGKRRITLSVSKRDLVDSKTSKPIDYISEGSRIEIAEEWLLVRPSGGRVFVDDEGNASTLLGESLVYLGNIQRYFD
jgi:myosin heavy subunit